VVLSKASPCACLVSVGTAQQGAEQRFGVAQPELLHQVCVTAEAISPVGAHTALTGALHVLFNCDYSTATLK